MVKKIAHIFALGVSHTTYQQISCSISACSSGAMAVPLSNLSLNLRVSKLCLGTMTFGEQNSLSESFNLLDKAFDSGINFFDSAEMYPVPQREETQGRSEEYFGRWLKERKIPRDRVVFATKVSGPSGQMTWIRGGPTCLDSKNIKEAIDNSLLRARTDYIDLYQVHWPDRLVYYLYKLHWYNFIIISSELCPGFSCSYVPMFGETDYDPVRQYNVVSFEEQLDALGRAIDAGKIRFVGVSNETPYGVMKFIQAAENNPAYPRIISVQNSYNLLCRNFDAGLAECCHLERVSLLAYSPLAMGLLSGKYLLPDGGADDARLNLFRGRYSEGESRYNLSNPTIREATKAYISIAERYGIHPVSLAIGFPIPAHEETLNTGRPAVQYTRFHGCNNAVREKDGDFVSLELSRLALSSIRVVFSVSQIQPIHVTMRLHTQIKAQRRAKRMTTKSDFVAMASGEDEPLTIFREKNPWNTTVVAYLFCDRQ
ncbi:hypothetical protein E3N88_32154 [Mikania micrantha]|uniref:NADP-dependent oxidoreductase domain-containing protein n=1 Tax=Mikania micrantha TaxID=192012 RepID=A0A5N6M7L6_9ASTR|nr:hypothetical protein E3N88_32154 [Mikania micrantha]